MAGTVVYPWAQFFAGMLVGCWIGAAVAVAGLLLLVGRRIRRLESINLLLRTKLKARTRFPRPATGTPGSMLVMPLPDSLRKPGRVARVN